MSNVWRKWEKHYSHFKRQWTKKVFIFEDGLFNKKQFGKDGNPRVLFILKEPNNPDGNSLIEEQKNALKYALWHTVARWAAVFLPQYSKFSAGKICKLEKNKLKDSLHCVAAINLKKLNGGPKADMRVINAFAHHDRRLLKKQIDDIKPDWIVACGTMDILIWLLDLRVDPRNPSKLGSIARYCNAKVIAWRHPSRVNKQEELMKKLRKVIRNSELSGAG